MWEELTGWLHKPFQQQMDPVNWVLLIVITATVAYAWNRVLDHVLEE